VGPVEDGEPQRVGGFRIPSGGAWPKVGETEQRVLGFPQSWLAAEPSTDPTRRRHPIRWVRWRLHVHRHGPYDGDDPGERNTEA
jgi:hypothetical protein